MFAWSDGKATLPRATIAQIADQFGTPLYVYDKTALLNQFRRLQQALPGVEIYYSVKANPHPKIIHIFVEQGAGCEIASGGEYVFVRRAGVDPERIVFAGPGKGRDELEYCVGHGIGELHLESFDEIELLQKVAERLRKNVNVAIRLNPGAAYGGGLLMGGQTTVFGFEEESLPEVLRALALQTRLKLCGVHLYTGTQILDAEALIRHWRSAMELARKTADLTGQPISTIDLGGGIGIPYFTHENELDLAALSNGAKELIAEARVDSRLAQARFVVEPGRFLAGPAGIYIARVRSVKSCRGTIFVVLDGGMNHHLAASGNLGQVIRRDYPMVNLSQESGVESTVVVAGPLCTPLDTLGRKVKMPLPKPGDLIGILQSGAYGMTASPLQFLTHPTPAEVLLRHGECELITPRESRFGAGQAIGSSP